MTPLRSVRHRLGFASLRAFALALGETESTVSRWESGARKPDLHVLRPRLKDLAERVGHVWDDSWLFEPPAPPADTKAPDVALTVEPAP
jgi:transcriptional regulator with XRE-family HTH domain